MNKNDYTALADLLESLTEIDRLADCSDRFFRQVYASRVKAIKVGGFISKLRAAAEKEEET